MGKEWRRDGEGVEKGRGMGCGRKGGDGEGMNGVGGERGDGEGKGKEGGD